MLDNNLIERARRNILEASKGERPKILDPFAGGGAIPLEGLRLGCSTYSNDYNPISVLIQKCILKYPYKYGKIGKLDQEWETEDIHQQVITNAALLEDVKKWSKWVCREVKEEIGEYYPEENNGNIPVGYIWARTLTCQNPSCGIEIPLMRQFWLAKNSNKKIAVRPFTSDGRIKFNIIGDGYERLPEDFDPTEGTVSRAIVTCPACGSVIKAEKTRNLFREGKSGEQMVVVASSDPDTSGKMYRVTSDKDIEVFKSAEKYLEKKREKLITQWGMDPIPDEPLPPENTLGFRVQRYGMLKWGDLFNSRQKLTLLTFAEKIRNANEKMLGDGYDLGYARAISSYLGVLLSRVTNRMSTLAYWYVPGEKIQPTFVRQALSMTWDYVELNVFNDSSGGWSTNVFDGINVLEHLLEINPPSPAKVTQASATSLPYENNFFDAVFTDPPYYDNVPYSYLSDFFYVWLKRAVGHLHPALFSTPLTPKSNEIVAYSHKEGGGEEGKNSFETNLKASFKEIHRILKPDGIAVIVYAHKSTEGWETLINSLLDSGLIITGAWPIDTEMSGRLRARRSAALASSIYIVARKMEREPTGFYNEVKEELRRYLDDKLERLWNEGVSGSDFFIAAIGSAIEVFGKYEKVMDYEGNTVRADRLLLDVRRIATDYAIRQILDNGFTEEISDLTRFYVLWRWNFGEAKVPFDDARKLAQSCGLDLANEWNRSGFIKKGREYISVLGPKDRNLEDLGAGTDLVDVLHQVLLLWEKGRREEMMRVLQETGYGRSDAFYRVAQAVSETLPNKSKEKKLLDGFLSGRSRIKAEISKEEGGRDATLDDF